ncbi:MAG: D-alanyl-D-alanine carboxypeptidase family protein [Clostridia bacterium]|nr:D-alanyl-D-alanine carboxypeptidase family protein [Clostridia bacterium]
MKNNQLKILFIFCFLILSILQFNNVFANDDLDLTCKSHIAINADDNTVLFDHHANERIYPASTTKILTAIIAIEKLDLNEEIVITKEMVDQIPYDSSVMGIMTDEIYTVKDLLYGLLLVSGNDVAIVLADRISGDMNSFAILMNEKLEEIGCKNTHFVNSHGYHDDNHYTTAYDMALIFSYCLKNDTFKEMISTRQMTVTPINNKERIFVLDNSNYMLYEDSGVYCPEIKGGKTGFTYEALGTFIGYATKGDMTIIIGSFGGLLDGNNLSSRFSDTLKISNYIFDHYEKTLIAQKGDYAFSLTDLNTSKIYTVGLSEDLYGVVPKNYIADYSVNMNPPYNTLLYNTSNIGSITINFPLNHLSYTKELSILSYTNYYDSSQILIYLTITIVLLLIVAKLEQIIKNKRKRINYKYKHRKLLNIPK